MSFSKTVAKLLQTQIPDFVFNSQESNNKNFCFTKQDKIYFYDIIFQISNQNSLFTIELTITKKKKDESRSIILHKNKRLSEIIFNKDFWWSYYPNDKLQTEKTINDAISKLIEVYPHYFEVEKLILNDEYQKMIDKYKEKYPQITNLEI